MQKYSAIMLTILLSTQILFSCGEGDVDKNYAASIKDKIWWGTLTNAGDESPQYYSVHFNANNSLRWSQLSGDYDGQWVLEKNKLTLTFAGLDVIVTAEISDDHTLTNINTNTENKVNSGSLVEDPIMNLDNTLWNGAEWRSNTLNIDGLSKVLQIWFQPELKYSLHRYIYTVYEAPYEKSPLEGFFRLQQVEGVHPEYFGVIVSDREIRGTNSFLYTFQLIKQ